MYIIFIYLLIKRLLNKQRNKQKKSKKTTNNEFLLTCNPLNYLNFNQILDIAVMNKHLNYISIAYRSDSMLSVTTFY